MNDTSTKKSHPELPSSTWNTVLTSTMAMLTKRTEEKKDNNQVIETEYKKGHATYYMYVFEMLKVIGTDPWRFLSTKINIYYTYNLLYIDLSDFIKTWPLGFRPARVQKRPGGKSVGQGRDYFNTTPSISSSVHSRLWLASTLFLLYLARWIRPLLRTIIMIVAELSERSTQGRVKVLVSRTQLPEDL